MSDDAIAAARADPALVVLEGFHALKHALRFGADVVAAVTADRAELSRLAAALAPDLADRLDALVREGPIDRPPHTGVVAVARRPAFDAAALLGAADGPPAVLLEDPRHPGNVGAVVRVAAAAGAAGVVTTGPRDPWDTAALRGSAGLHFALPVGRIAAERLGHRPLVAVDPGGDPAAAVPPGALLAFGTERHGLSPELLQRAGARIAIPMRPGVSSLNLATAAAVVLYMARSGFSQRSIVHTGRMPTDS